MKPPKPALIAPLALALLGGAVGAAGVYIGETDDAPGAALLGLVAMLGLFALSVRSVWRHRGERVEEPKR